MELITSLVAPCFRRQVLLAAALVLVALISATSGDLPPPNRHFKIRGPPRGHPPLKRFIGHGKWPRPPLRVHHVHLNYPPPPQPPTRPIKHVYSSGPPRIKTIKPAWKPGYTNIIHTNKAHFNPSPPAHFLTPLIDDNSGPIHTIPAPNLGPNSDRPIPPPALISSIAGAITPYSTQIQQGPHNGYDLGHHKGYEVFEEHVNDAGIDPAKSNVGLPYYAPDPDPSLPAPQVPVTRDPHSHPSNGKAPLDLILQQQLEHQQQQVQAGPALAHLLTGGFEGYSQQQQHYRQQAVGGIDPNSQFLQAFQDQYKYQPEYIAQGSEVKSVSTKNQKEENDDADIDYDSGAEVRYSISSGQGYQHDDQDDAGSENIEDDDQESPEDDDGSFGQRIKPKKSHA